MYDALCVCLKYDNADREKLREGEMLLPRLNALLEKHGWEYTQFRNVHRPVKGTDPDDTWHEAELALKDAEWLKEYEPYIEICTWIDVCTLNEIVVPDVEPVDEVKLGRYREYYEKEHKYAHGIIVDEDKNLRDGYITYLLAQGEGRCRPPIMRVRKEQIFKKIIVRKCNDEEEDHTWYYEDGPAVCPGDVVVGPGGKQMKVEYIGYVAGKYDCGRFESVKT